MDFFFSKTKIVTLDGIHLTQDHILTGYKAPWDDFNFITTFNLTFVMNNNSIQLGEIKLLANGYKDTSSYLANKGKLLSDGKTYEISEVLDPLNVVSLASDIKFYQQLNKILNTVQTMQLLQGICDASYYQTNIDEFKTWDGFHESLLRDGTSVEARINKGYQIATGQYSPPKQFDIEIETLPDSFEPLTFSFNSERPLGPTNINLLIGKNGVGKSHILKHLTELITGIVDSGKSWPYFHKLIVSAYSPFETFHTKSKIIELLTNKNAPDGVNSRELNKERKQRLQKTNKYSYIGYRNESGKFQLDWPIEHSARSLANILEFDYTHGWWEAKTRYATLLETLQLSIDFDTLAFTTNDKGLIEIDETFRKKPATEKRNINFRAGITFLKEGKAKNLSSGQIIYSYIIPALVAEIEQECLIIIDEPELYLHPNMEVALIEMLKLLLQQTNSYAIIATHSAVMAREVDKEAVSILRRTEAKTTVSQPSIETFGGAIDLIIGTVFNDYKMPKPYQLEIDKKIGSNGKVDEVMKQIGADIGDEALVYIASKFTAEDSDKFFEDR